MITYIPTERGCFCLKKFTYHYKYKPLVLDYIMNSNLLNEHKQEKEILVLLLKGKTCLEIADDIGYCERTIQTRRKDIYEKTKDLMI